MNSQKKIVYVIQIQLVENRHVTSVQFLFRVHTIHPSMCIFLIFFFY